MATMQLKVAPRDFWEMPLFIFADMLMDFNGATRTQGISRKELLMLEREAKAKYGWV
jgi:hypothetical protein